jgi:hypothetical protein
MSVRGWVADLSRGGLFMRSHFLDRLGAEVSVGVEIGDELVKADGLVTRLNHAPPERGMGICFRQLTRREHRKLANFLIERRYQALSQV